MAERGEEDGPRDTAAERLIREHAEMLLLLREIARNERVGDASGEPSPNGGDTKDRLYAIIARIDGVSR